jgi:hypothetical protein
LQQVRAHAQSQLASLPQHLRTLESSVATSPYVVTIASALHTLADEVDRRTQALPGHQPRVA